MIQIGKIFRSIDDKRFIVDDVVEKEDGTWVFYSQGEKKFNCLLEAFLLRFYEVTNEGYQSNTLFRGNTQNTRY